MPEPEQPSEIIPEEIAKDLPSEVRQSFEMMAAFGPAQHPLARHFTPAHIDKMLEGIEHDGQRAQERHAREIKDRHSSRVTSCVAGLLALLIVGVLWIFIPADKVGSFKEYCEGIVALIGVGFGAYSYGKARKEE